MIAASDLIRAPSLELEGVRHAFFTRRGGASEGVFASLNCGQGSSDDAERVAENRRRAAEVFGRPPEALLTCRQAHTARAVVASAPFAERPEADAVATRTPGLICAALAADCAPVLLADPAARVVAAAHAGWRGALGGVVEAAIRAMEGLGADRARVRAAVGPCIGPRSYEVGLEFEARFVGEDEDFARFFAPGAAPDKRRFDLPAFVVSRLQAAGVASPVWVGEDTFADESRFYSFRRATHRGETDYGRLLSAICLV